MKYFSMFSGIGGFELGITRSFDVQKVGRGEEVAEGINEKREGLHSIPSERTIPINNRDNELFNTSIDEGQSHCVGFSEVDKYAIQIYQKHFKGHKKYGDATNIIWSEVEDFDLFVGGFPCQAFSIAGKRRGFSDTRGTMFFQIARALREKQPCFCVLENVKGLLSHDKGQTFATILTTFSELGYDAQWQVLNSKNHGVPQNRERVFIIGHLRGQRRPQVFPIGSECGETYTIQPPEQSKRKRIPGEIPNEERDWANIESGGARIRRLTPTECERLQSFPDGWTEGISDTQRYKCLGNAVTVNVIEAIIKELFNDKK